MSRSLPARPSLDHLRKQAKALLRRYGAGDPAAVAAFAWRRANPLPPKLADAQHALARDYGFGSWATLKHHVESLTSDDPATALEAAVRLDDAERLRDVLIRFPALGEHLDDAMPHGDFGATPLIAAVNQRNREMIDVLLEAGADINQRSHWWAGGFGVLGDDTEMNAYLISRGAEVDAYSASRSGMTDRLRQIIEADPAVVRARFGDGQTALHVAATVEIAAMLLDSGADIDAIDVDHESTAAQYLVRAHPDVAQYLVSRGCRTDILLASALGDTERIERHLETDPRSIYTTVSSRYFPMHNPRAGGTIYIWTLGNLAGAHALAREFGHSDALALLMRHTPADLALALACQGGDEAAAAELRRGMAESGARTGDEVMGRLAGAANLNDTRAVRLLLDAGWPATARDDGSATALHWAAFHGNLDMLELLLQRGADADAVETSFDGTARDWAEHGVDISPHRASGDYPGVLGALAGARTR